MRLPRLSNSPVRRLAFTGVAFLAVLLSCGKDVTAPGVKGVYNSLRGNFSVAPQFPEVLTQTAGATGSVPFDRVRIVLRHADGSIALDTLVNFPVGSDSVPLVLNVPLLASTPASGEPLSLNLGYVNAAGDTVFKGSVGSINVTPTIPGSPPPPPVQVPVKYSGPGANAVAVKISPRSASVVSGSSFGFSATAVDATNAPVAGAPIIWSSLDPSRATITPAGAGTALPNVRGSARIVAQLLTGPADTVSVTVSPAASAIAAVSGSGQTAGVGATLAQPLVVRVTATDGLGVGGVTVNFAVASGGGSVTSASVTTDASGNASTGWKLGSTVGTQSVTASSTVGSVTFTATATPASPV
jgi:hypothetical protein